MPTDTPATPSAGADVGRLDLPDAVRAYLATIDVRQACNHEMDLGVLSMARYRLRCESADLDIDQKRAALDAALSAQAERPDAGQGLPGVEEPRLWYGQRSLADWAAEQAERLRSYFKHARYPAEKTLIGPVGLEEWKAGYATASDHLVVLDYLAAHPASSPPASEDRLREVEDGWQLIGDEPEEETEGDVWCDFGNGLGGRVADCVFFERRWNHQPYPFGEWEPVENPVAWRPLPAPPAPSSPAED